MSQTKDFIADIYPLSPMQQGMLLHCLYTPRVGMYFEQLCCTFRGPLNTAAFKQAWQRAVDAHPILRTAFNWQQRPEPFQIVYRQVKLPWQQIDWRELDAAAQQRQLTAFLQSDRERGFALDRPPLMRLTLIQTAQETFHLVWSHHHLLLDGWSVSLLLAQILAQYEALCHGRDLSLETGRPYSDYIAWLQQQPLSEAEAFWHQTLGGFTAPRPPTAGPAAGPSTAPAQEYSEQELKLPPAATAALQTLARQHHLTLNTLIQGACALLLSRHSGATDIVFGVTVSGRPADLAGAETAIGLFINTLPLRAQATPSARLLPWLAALQAQQAALQQYTYSPLAQIQKWSDAPPGQPLFESIVVFENYPLDAGLWQRRANLEIERVLFIGARTNYPLTLLVFPETELTLRLIYDSRRFDDAAIVRLLGHLQTILENIVAWPEQTLSTLLAGIPAPGVAAVEPAAPPPPTDPQALPSTPLEETIAAVFGEILNLEQIGAHENFFALGGDSLQAAQVIVRLQETFHIELTLQNIVETPTVASLALSILQKQTETLDDRDDVLAEIAQLSDKEAETLLALLDPTASVA